MSGKPIGFGLACTYPRAVLPDPHHPLYLILIKDDVNKGSAPLELPDLLCPATVTTNQYTNLSMATRGPPFQPKQLPPVSPFSPLSLQLTNPFYSTLLGIQEWRTDTLDQIVTGLTAGGLSAVSRCSYEPSYLVNSWALFTSGGFQHSWAASRGITP